MCTSVHDDLAYTNRNYCEIYDLILYSLFPHLQYSISFRSILGKTCIDSSLVYSNGIQCQDLEKDSR